MSVLISPGCHNKILWTRWLKQQEFISHGNGDYKSKIKVPVGSVPGESSPGHLLTMSSHRPLLGVCRQSQKEEESGLMPLLMKTLIPAGGAATLMASAKPIYLLKAPSPNTITLEGRASTYEFGNRGHNSFKVIRRLSERKCLCLIGDVCDG